MYWDEVPLPDEEKIILHRWVDEWYEQNCRTWTWDDAAAIRAAAHDYIEGKCGWGAVEKLFSRGVSDDIRAIYNRAYYWRRTHHVAASRAALSTWELRPGQRILHQFGAGSSYGEWKRSITIIAPTDLPDWDGNYTYDIPAGYTYRVIRRNDQSRQWAVAVIITRGRPNERWLPIRALWIERSGRDSAARAGAAEYIGVHMGLGLAIKQEG